MVQLDSGLFLVLAMLIIAACFYLPEHIATIANRIWYYCFGDDEVLKNGRVVGQGVYKTGGKLVREAATQFLGKEGVTAGAGRVAAGGAAAGGISG